MGIFKLYKLKCAWFFFFYLARLRRIILISGKWNILFLYFIKKKTKFFLSNNRIHKEMNCILKYSLYKIYYYFKSGNRITKKKKNRFG